MLLYLFYQLRHESGRTQSNIDVDVGGTQFGLRFCQRDDAGDVVFLEQFMRRGN